MRPPCIDPRPARRIQAALLVLLATAACAAWPQAAAQQRVDLRKLDAYFAQARADWQVPGMAVAIVKDGQVPSPASAGTPSSQPVFSSRSA